MATFQTSSGDAYVAFLDVLGFKALVENNPHEKLLQIYNNALLGGITLGLSNRKYMMVQDHDGESFTSDTTAVPVNSLVVSDSVIIWSSDDSSRSFGDVVSVVRGAMAHCHFNGLPLRGGISLGPVSWLDSKLGSATHNVQSSVFGVGLTRAYQLEKDQEWAGCVVAGEAVDRFKERIISGDSAKPIPDHVIRLGLREYWVPFKDRCSKHVVVDWVNHPEVGIYSDNAGNAFIQHGKITKEEDYEAIRRKVDNTLTFVRYVNPNADKTGLEAAWARWVR
jgi:hypothetical protein